MKKRLISCLGAICCSIFIVSSSAFGWNFQNVGFSVDCFGFTINGEMWTSWIYHSGPQTIAYSLSLDGVEVISETVIIDVDLDCWCAAPFEITGSWAEELTEDLEVSGSIEWVVTDGDFVTFQTRTPSCAPLEGQGCTPGYWKNHLDEWVSYSPSDDFDLTFGTDLFEPDITLEEAAKARGGAENRLARHATAALLSAAHPLVDYPFTVEEVKAAVQFGETTILEEANELGCPL